MKESAYSVAKKNFIEITVHGAVQGGRLAVGDCYRYAYQLLREHPEAILAHGTVVHPWDGTEFEHAWVELDGKVYDWQTKTMHRDPMTVAEFDAAWKTRNVRKYQAEQAMKNAVRHGHYGPWVGEKDLPKSVAGAPKTR